MTEVITNRSNLENTQGWRDFYSSLEARLITIETKLAEKDTVNKVWNDGFNAGYKSATDRYIPIDK